MAPPRDGSELVLSMYSAAAGSNTYAIYGEDIHVEAASA